MQLLAEERKQYILKKINEKGLVNASELSTRLKVSAETIRKDLDQMEEWNQLKKVYGGAIKIHSESNSPPKSIREFDRIREKKRIGRAASKLIKDDETIIIDEGSTTLQITQFIEKKKNLTIITNSVPVLTSLLRTHSFNGKLIFTGGEVETNHLRASGLIAESAMDGIYADKAFLSVHGVSLNKGMTSYFSEEASLSRRFLDNAKEGIVLFDHSKIDANKLYKIADFNEFSTMICDQAAPANWKSSLSGNNIRWITVSWQ